MKKSIKLLVLVLTLVLVCGVFAVSAFAASADGVGYDYANHTTATGETLFSWMDFEATTFVSDKASVFTESNGNFVNSGTNVTSNNGKGFGLYFANRSGEAWIDSVKQEENKFLVIWNDKTTLVRTGQGAYFSMSTYATTPANGADAEKKPESMMYNYQAMVIDYDIKFGEGTVPTGTGFQLHTRRYKADGVRDFGTIYGANGGGTVNSFNILYRMQDGKIKLYTQDTSWNTSTAAIPFEEWMHFTIIMETPIDDNGTPDNKNDDKFEGFYLYVYINDQLALESKKFGYGSLEAKDYYNGNMTMITMAEARWSFGVDNVENASKIALDNCSVRNYDLTYDMTSLKASLESGDLSTWDGSIYDKELLPYGVTTASIEREGKTVEFDSLKKAIENAQPDEVITLHRNVTDEIKVASVVTINKNGYTANLTAANGYAVFDGDKDDVAGNEGTYYSQESSGSLRVMWQACGCGEHISATTATVPLNNNIYDSYFAATGKLPECSYQDGNTLKVLTGWTASGNAGISGNLSTDAVVTAAMIGKTLRLSPVYTEYTATAQILNADGSVKKDYYQDSSLSTILAAAKNGETVKLLSNYDNPNNGAVIGVANTITLDLNGYRVAVFTVDAKHSVFQVRNFTVMSSRAGGQIYDVKANSTNKNFNGDAVFTPAAAGANVYINGADEEGNTTVALYCATIAQGYNSHINVYIDGGEYHRNASDNYGMIDMRCASEVVVKNAYISSLGRLFRMGPNGTATVKTFTVDNCVINGTVMDGDVNAQRDDMTITFTNTYFNGGINPVKGTWTIGEGCYFSEAASYNDLVKFAEGTKVVDINLTKTFDVITNKFEYTHPGNWGNSFVPFEDSVAMTFKKVVLDKDAAPATITWYDTDGTTVLAVTEAYAGVQASAPVTDVAGTDGWVRACYADWSEDAIVPAGVTEHSFTLKENSAVVYSAGKVDVMFNFDMIAHFQYNYYIPAAPEGITFVNATFSGAVGSHVVTSGTAVTDTQGNAYTQIARWPGAANTAKDANLIINFTYDGQAIAYTAPSFTIADYANYVFTNEKYEGTPLVTAMADMLAYVNAANVLVGGSPAASFNAVYTKAQAYMTPVDDLKTEQIDLTEASKYFTNIEISYNTGLSGMSIQVTAVEGYSIGFKLEYAHGMPIIGQTRRFNNAGAFCAHNIRTWGIAETFTIQVYNGHDMKSDNQSVLFDNYEVIAEFEYSLAAYLGANMDKLDDAQLGYVKAILAYGSSAGQYMDWKDQNGIGR